MAVNLERGVEAASEAAEIYERGMKEAAKEAKVKVVTAKETALLSFFVKVCTYICKMI